MRVCFIAAIVIGLAAVVACSGETRQSSAPVDPEDTVVRDEPVGRQEDDIDVARAKSDGNGDWQRITIEGITFETPAGPVWRVDVVGDPCSARLERFVVMENQQTGDRIQIKFLKKTVAAEFNGDEAKLDGVTSRIQASFSGERILPELAQKMIPFPTSIACDPKASNEVPTLVPLETPDPAVTVVVDDTPTPITPPAPPPMPQ